MCDECKWSVSVCGWEEGVCLCSSTTMTRCGLVLFILSLALSWASLGQWFALGRLRYAIP